MRSGGEEMACGMHADVDVRAAVRAAVFSHPSSRTTENSRNGTMRRRPERRMCVQTLCGGTGFADLRSYG